jgi:hypothetical protein
MRFITTCAVPFAPVTAGPADLPWAPAHSLDCALGRVRIPDMGLWMPPTDYTLECWNYSRGGGVDVAFNMEADDAGHNRVLAHLPWTGDGHLYFDSGDCGGAGRLHQPAPPELVGAWHHLAFQVDSQAPAMRVFLDGHLFAEQPQLDTYKSRPTDFLIGHTHLGLLGEFRLWNRVRTPEQLREHLASTFTGPRPGLIGCWRLDDTLQNGGRIQDRSGYARHGILNRY